MRHNLFGDKMIQNSLKIDATYSYDNDLLLKQETQKCLHVLEADMIAIWKILIWCLKLKGWLFDGMSSKWPPLRLTQ